MRKPAPVRGATTESLGVPRIRDLMDPKPITVGPQARVGEVARVLIKKRAHGAAVVDDEGRFLGFISGQGLVKALNDDTYFIRADAARGLARLKKDAVSALPALKARLATESDSSVKNALRRSIAKLEKVSTRGLAGAVRGR